MYLDMTPNSSSTHRHEERNDTDTDIPRQVCTVVSRLEEHGNTDAGTLPIDKSACFTLFSFTTDDALVHCRFSTASTSPAAHADPRACTDKGPVTILLMADALLLTPRTGPSKGRNGRGRSRAPFKDNQITQFCHMIPLPWTGFIPHVLVVVQMKITMFLF